MFSAQSGETLVGQTLNFLLLTPEQILIMKPTALLPSTSVVSLTSRSSNSNQRGRVSDGNIFTTFKLIAHNKTIKI
jgi:hypothetical protein